MFHWYIISWAKFLIMLLDFQYMLDGYLGQIKAMKHRIELISLDKIPTPSAPYRTVPGHENSKHTRSTNVGDAYNQTGSHEWASSIVFAPIIDGTFPFCMD